MSVQLVDHPLAKHLLTLLRSAETPPAEFRRHAHALSTLILIEATRGIRTQTCPGTTPLEPFEGECLAEGLAVVPVLRAGLAMLEPALEFFPDVSVGYIGLERDHRTAIATSYYCKLPRLDDRTVICVDPMLATGGSAAQAIGLLKAHGAKRMVLVTVVATPEGIARVEKDHCDIPIYTAAVDRGLDERKYILPGLGDFGDRLYGTL